MSTTTKHEQAAHTRKIRSKMTEEQRWAFDGLRRMFPKGSTVYTSLDGEPSRSGMTRWINVHSVKRGEIAYATGLMAVAWPDYFKRGRIDSRHPDSIKVGGCGMDMGFHVAYELSRLLYGDGYALRHRWL